MKADRRTIQSWSLYDFANSSFTTVVVTFVYAVYFAEAIADNPDAGLSQWSAAIAISGVLVALLSPFMGAVADAGGHRKRFLFISSVVCIMGSVVLFFPLPGQVIFALTTFVVANVAFEMAGVFYNAYLPDIAPPEKIGQISGYGWGLGYVGGLLCLVMGYLVLVVPETPPFGLSAETGSNVRAITLLVAAWFAVFSIPMFLWVREPEVKDAPSMWKLFRSAGPEIAETFRLVRRYKQTLRLLIARLIYNDGLITIFALSGIYASATFGINIFVFGIVLNMAAGLGAFAMGYVDDYLGGKKTILITIVGMSLATALAVLTRDVFWFWVAAFIIAILAGPNQSASRSLFARFVPDDHETEFFGFFAFSGKFTAFLGPALVAMLAGIYDQRTGLAVVVPMFIVGGLLLLAVNEKEGIRASGRVEGA